MNEPAEKPGERIQGSILGKGLCNPLNQLFSVAFHPFRFAVSWFNLSAFDFYLHNACRAFCRIVQSFASILVPSGFAKGL
jgi:hypothetical protein